MLSLNNIYPYTIIAKGLLQICLLDITKFIEFCKWQFFGEDSQDFLFGRSGLKLY